jgi:hydrogenase maturation protein HypF
MRAVIAGVVQGVGFRPTVHRVATSLGLRGRVWNDGSRVIIETDDADRLMTALMKNLPPLAIIESVEIDRSPLDPSIKGFSIVPSEHGEGGVSIPTDTAVCDDCLREMRTEGRRKGYAFTTCTNCGARFTLLRTLPYDRASTAMVDFPMCDECTSEYNDSNDRRFHHQTVCCPKCGPRYYLLDKNGNELPGDPIPEFARAVDAGKIGIAKSWGGMHICTTVDRVPMLRRWYRREQKPFAIMVRDLDAAKRYTLPTAKEISLLTSPNRPIVLVHKNPEHPIEMIAPGLDSVGVFLPYTGMQHILFDCLDHDALVMTSANLPGEPMILDDRDVLDLGADVYLLHNQTIINRADDSVVRAYGDKTQFIRKSRGFIPSFIDVKYKGAAVGIGAQENLSGTVAIGGRMYQTQYIGNGESLNVAEYLQTATDSLMDLTHCHPRAVAMDLHPGYANRHYGKALAERCGAQLLEVQHHWAHAAALIAEHGLDEAVVLTVDGTGHGTDGTAWGGEVLQADLTSFDRVAHLEDIPLLGSEKALYDLKRLKFAIDCMNGIDSHLVDDGTADIMRKMMRTSVRSSSLGRILDALAFTLGVCTVRTYDGEPAMKTEPLLARGHLVPGFETEAKGGVIPTTELFAEIGDNSASKEDVAYTVVHNIVRAMADAACDRALAKGISYVGISGGVSYSAPITKMAEDAVVSRGLKFIMHERLPNGDGGISAGQAAIALRSLE